MAPGGSTESGIPQFVWAQEPAQESLTAAISPQLAKSAKASSNGGNVYLGSGDESLPQVEKKLKCTAEGCTSQLCGQTLPRST